MRIASYARVLGALLLAVPATWQPATGDEWLHCLRLDPATATLEGTLILRTFAGPPNYESIAEGDRPEPALVLKLDSPVCVTEHPTDETAGPILGFFDQFQLAAVAIAPPGRELVGTRVRAFGSLFEAETGHHHTRVLINLSKLTSLK